MTVPPVHAAGVAPAWRRVAAVAALLAIAGAWKAFAPPAVPLALTISMSVVALAAAAEPVWGLALLAPLLPLGDFLGEVSRPALPWTTPLAFAYGTGRLLAHAGGRADPRASAAHHALPLSILTVVACGSAVVDLAVRQAVTSLPADYYAGLFQAFGRTLFRLPGRYEGLQDALQFVLGLMLTASAAAALRRPGGRVAAGRPAAALLIAVAVSGVTLVAALTWARLVQLASRSTEPMSAALHLLMTARITPAFPDYNAAGTLLGSGLLAGSVLWAGTGRRRLAALMAALVGPALWLTGSRSALFFLLVVGFALAVRLHAPLRRPGRRLVAATLLLPLLLAGALWRPRGDPEGNPWRAVTLRAELAATALRMTADHPLFGVGLGQFYWRSDSYASNTLRAVYPRENAHNNFLQLLAELGLIGFGAFVWLVGICAVAAWRGLRQPEPVLAAAAGATAFVLGTCLVGHPLLVQEVAYPFWLMLGVSLGLTERQDDRRRLARHRAWLPVLVTVAIAASLLWRIPHAIDARAFEHQGAGWSAWQRDADGRRYRTMGRRAHVFVNASADRVHLPVKAAPGVEGASVTVSVDGRPYGRVALQHEWRVLPLLLPRAHGERRLRRLELRVENGPAGAPSLAWVGRATARGGVP